MWEGRIGSLGLADPNYWVGQKVHSGFSVKGYGKTQTNFLANPILYRKWINDKVLLYITGNYIQYPVINHNGKEYEKECICIFITKSLCCTVEISTRL